MSDEKEQTFDTETKQDIKPEVGPTHREVSAYIENLLETRKLRKQGITITMIAQMSLASLI